MKKMKPLLLCLTALVLIATTSVSSSFLPTVVPSISKTPEPRQEDIDYPLILNRISAGQQRESKRDDEPELVGPLRDVLSTTTPQSKKRKKYLKKIVVRRRPHKKNRIHLHEKGYRKIGPMEYASKDVEIAQITSPSITKVSGFPSKSFQKKNDFMESEKIINGIKLKKWKTKQPVQRPSENLRKISFQQNNKKSKFKTKSKSEKYKDASLYFGDKLSDNVSDSEREGTLNSNELKNHIVNDNYINKVDVDRIQILRETYFSTTEKASDIIEVNISTLGYTVTPQPKDTTPPPSKRNRSSPTPPPKSNKSTPSPSNDLLSTPATSKASLRTIPEFDRSHLPKAFGYVPEEYLSNLTAQDILFGDPLTHTHPLGTHPLLPVHEGFDIPHSHPPYTEEPVVHLLPKLSSLMKSFLFPPSESSSAFGGEPLNNKKRHTKPPPEIDGLNGTYSYQRNDSYFSHEVRMPGHHQFHSQGLPGAKIHAKSEEFEDPSPSGISAPDSTSPSSTSSPTLQYSPILPEEFISSLVPRTGTSAKMNYARRKKSFTMASKSYAN